MEKIVRTQNLTLTSKSMSKVALNVATALLLTTTGIPITQALAAETGITLNQTFNI